MSERRRNEKEEEKREKEDEKRSEKTWDEKWRHNPVRLVTLAAILIWGGIVGFLQNTSVADQSWWQGWAVFFVGTGVILLVKAGFRLRPAQRRPVGGTIIIGVILLIVGLGDILGWESSWPVILIAVGVIFILFAIFRRRGP